jgi:hypothetical protein
MFVGGQTATATPPVRVDTIVSRIVFCQSDSELDSMQLMARFQLRNLGKKPLLHLADPTVGVIEIANTVEELESGGADYRMELEVWGTPQRRKPLTKSLRTLAPGGIYEFDGMIPIVAKRPGYTGRVGVWPGRYFVRVTVVPLPGGEGVRRQLEGDLHSEGGLWSEPMTTVPLRIEIPLQRRVERC